MPYFKFKTDSGETYRVDFWEEKRCFICFSYWAKLSKEKEDGVLQTVQTLSIPPESYTTLNTLKKVGNEERAIKYINRFIFSNISLLAEEEKEEDEELGTP